MNDQGFKICRTVCLKGDTDRFRKTDPLETRFKTVETFKSLCFPDMIAFKTQIHRSDLRVFINRSCTNFNFCHDSILL